MMMNNSINSKGDNWYWLMMITSVRSSLRYDAPHRSKTATFLKFSLSLAPFWLIPLHSYPHQVCDNNHNAPTKHCRGSSWFGNGDWSVWYRQPDPGISLKIIIVISLFSTSSFQLQRPHGGIIACGADQVFFHRSRSLFYHFLHSLACFLHASEHLFAPCFAFFYPFP